MQTKETKVSIVVAIYKSEKFLDKLISSLIGQTYKNIEIILVDDGSPDGSGLICDQYAGKDTRIKVIHKVNGGACSARNEGINAATGDYLLIVDGDDWLSLDCVEYLLFLAISTNSDMAFSDRIFTSLDQTQIKKDHIRVLSPEKAAGMIIYPYMEIGPWNKIYKMSLLRDNGISFSVPWSGEGLYFASTAAQHANHVCVGDRKVYNYRLNNPNSGLTNYNVTMGFNALKNIKFIGDNLYIKTPYLRNAVRWHIWKNYGFLLFLIIATNSEKTYSKEYRDCVRQIRHMSPAVVVKSKLGFRKKLGIIRFSVCPVRRIKASLKKRAEQFEKDKME